MHFAIATGCDQPNCMQTVLLVVVTLAGVGDFAVVGGQQIPPPLTERIFVNVVSHVALTGVQYENISVQLFVSRRRKRL